MESLKFAAYYARRGWDVFPVKPKEKTPMVKWADEATHDPDKVTRWFTNGYSSANIGIATGARSGIIVLDVDTGHDGDSSLAELIRIHGSLPDTVTARTGGGGRHIVFSHPGITIPNSASKLGAGLDIRGDGGYIVAPPSIHPSGNAYEWIENPSQKTLCEMPPWMIEILQKPAEFSQPRAESIPADDQGAIPSGTRNQVLASLAGTMRRRGMSEEAIYTALITENKKRCVPALPLNEVAVIAKSVMRYEPTAPVATANRNRLQVETAFIKSIYEHPINYTDFAWIKPGMFSDRAYQKFWAEMEKEQNTTRAAAEAGILEHMAAAIEFDPDRLDEYANQLVKYGYLDTLSKAAREVQQAADAGQVEKAAQIIQGMADEKAPTANCQVQTVDNGLDNLEKMMKGGHAVIKTGVQPIDRITGGLPINSLSILAARPGVGKTSCTWQIARTAAMGGEKVLYVSLEMKSWELWLKAACGLAEMRPVDIIGDDPQFDHDRQRIEEQIIPELRRTYGGKIEIFDDSSVGDTSVIWRVTQMSGARLVIVDHMNLVTDSGESQNLRLDVISRSLKAMAKKLNVHVMVVHQLNRALEKRDDKRPQLSDLRESGHIEENADQVFFLHRPDYWDVEETKCRYSETMFIVGKGRLSGAGNTAGMIYDLSQQWFYRKDEAPSNYRAIKQVLPGTRTVSLTEPAPHWAGDD